VAAGGRRHGRGRARAVLEGDHPRRLALHHNRAATGSCAPDRVVGAEMLAAPTGGWVG
jgi:hypothetical protein